MIKNKKSKLYLKISILFALLVAFIGFAIPKTYAYTLDANGNLQSDNLLNVNDYYSISQNVTVDIDNSINFNSAGSVAVELWNTSSDYVSTPIIFSISGSLGGAFRKLAYTNYLRFKPENNTTNDIWFDISSLITGQYYYLSCVVSNSSISTKFSNIMLNEGSTSLPYEPIGTWYKDGSLPSQIYNSFNGASVYLYNIMDTNNYVVSEQLTNLTAQSSAITSENLPIIYDYLLSLDYENLSMNQLKFYIQIDLNNTINSSLLFNFNDTTLQKTIDLINTATNQTWSYDSHSDSTINYNLQMVVNTEFNSFNRIIYNYIYMPDYSHLDISMSLDGYSYSQGFQSGVNSLATQLEIYKKEAERLQGVVNSQRQTIENLNNELNSSGVGWKPLFFAMADTPFKVVKNALGFEVFGVDLFGAFVGLLTLLAILWVIKKIIK